MKSRTFLLAFAIFAFLFSGLAFREARYADINQTIIPATQEFSWLSPAQGYAVAAISLAFALYASLAWYRSDGSRSATSAGQ